MGRISVFLVGGNHGRNIDLGWVCPRILGNVTMDGSSATSLKHYCTCLALGRSKGRIFPIDTVSGAVDGGLHVRDDGIMFLVKHVYRSSSPDSLRDVGGVTIVDSGELYQPVVSFWLVLITGSTKCLNICEG